MCITAAPIDICLLIWNGSGGIHSAHSHLSANRIAPRFANFAYILSLAATLRAYIYIVGHEYIKIYIHIHAAHPRGRLDCVWLVGFCGLVGVGEYKLLCRPTAFTEKVHRVPPTDETILPTWRNGNARAASRHGITNLCSMGECVRTGGEHVCDCRTHMICVGFGLNSL